MKISNGYANYPVTWREYVAVKMADNNKSVEVVAAESGIMPRTLQAWLDGKREMGDMTLARIYAAINNQ